MLHARRLRERVQSYVNGMNNSTIKWVDSDKRPR